MSRSDELLGMTGRDLVASFPRRSLTADQDRVRIRELAAREGEYVPASDALRSRLADPLPYELYAHQATALDALDDGENVTVATSTASGKTAVYGLQIARNLLDAGVLAPDGSRASEGNDASTALALYPMKALTKDQKRNLDGLYETLGLDVRVRIYDGDTPSADRRTIRAEADVILTNFQAISVYLGHHDKWSRLFSALDLVAIDESHTHTGVQGMHAAWILRRLRRVVDYWGGDPQYTLTSATVGNPGDHSAQLVGEDVTVVDEDGSPRGARDLVLWNPPPQSKAEPDESRADIPETDGPDAGGSDTDSLPEGADTDGDERAAERVPASIEAPRVFAHLTAAEIQTLLFCPSRKLTELAVERAETFYANNAASYDSRPRTEPYNAGMGRRTRHARETEFKTGSLAGLATTSALELGIDIGDLDATVLLGYPGQRQSFWQRIGRAGRGASRSLAVMVADHRTLDQYVIENPEYLLDSDVEDAVVDTDNNAVFVQHLRCAAEELALTEDDAPALAERDRLERAVEMLRRSGELEGYLDAAAHYAGAPRPQADVSIYATGDDEYRVTLAEDATLGRELDIEPVAKSRAFRDYHEGAVRLHDGQQFEVTAVVDDHPQPFVELTPVDVDYYTQTRTTVNVVDADSERSREVNGYTLHQGTGTVLVEHESYDRVHIGNGERLEQNIPTDRPPVEMQTQLCWLEVPDRVETALVHKYREFGVETGMAGDHPPQLGYVAGLHAAEHAMIKTAPLELLVDKNDLGGLSTLVLDTHMTLDDETTRAETVAAAERAIERRTETLDGVSSGWFVYDAVEGGLGFSRAIYEQFEALAARARDSLRDCGCGRPNGCPACTFDRNCGNDNKPLLRASAVDVFDHLLGEGSDLEAHLPDEEYGGERRPSIFYS